MNGDGYEDAAIGAPDGNAVYLLYGQADRFDDFALEDLPTLQGEDSGDDFGSAIAGVGMSTVMAMMMLW